MDSPWSEAAPGILYHQRLKEFKWLVHGFSQRRGTAEPTESSLGFNGYQPDETVAANRRRLLAALGFPDAVDLKATPSLATGRKAAGPFLVPIQQIHSATVHRAELASIEQFPKPGDALITSEPGLLLSILTADCMPVLLVDPTHRAVAAVHAGWRGAAAHILLKTLQTMALDCGTKSHDCLAVSGPAIGGCCYQVGPEVSGIFQKEFPQTFTEFFRADPQAAGRGWLDLHAVAQIELREAGLPEEQIFTTAPCTSCQREKYFSHRADQGNTGRMMALIGIRC